MKYKLQNNKNSDAELKQINQSVKFRQNSGAVDRRAGGILGAGDVYIDCYACLPLADGKEVTGGGISCCLGVWEKLALYSECCFNNSGKKNYVERAYFFYSIRISDIWLFCYAFSFQRTHLLSIYTENFEDPGFSCPGYYSCPGRCWKAKATEAGGRESKELSLDRSDAGKSGSEH